MVKSPIITLQSWTKRHSAPYAKDKNNRQNANGKSRRIYAMKILQARSKARCFCGCCGHKMRISSTVNPKFHCYHTRIAPDAECHRLGVGSADLENTLFGTIQKRMQTKMGVGGFFAADVPQNAPANYRQRLVRRRRELNK
jgi:hypothetical protein